MNLLLALAMFFDAPAFEFRDNGAGALELLENGRPVFAYNYGMQLERGAPEDRRRSSYVHPVYAPDGTVVTDDFPRDHYHHRGIFWAWPIVELQGKRHDLWMGRGVQHRFERWLGKSTSGKAARIEVENGWYVGERKVVKETVAIEALPSRATHRVLNFTVRLEALEPLRIAGAPESSKGYGGFSVRFAPRKETAITTDSGREQRDTDMVPHAWAELAGTFETGRASLRIDIDPKNPGAPNGWCLRHYGFLGVNYPGTNAVDLQPGKPLVLSYRVTVRSGRP